MIDIEDKEITELFHIESNEHIQKIEEGLVKLEEDPADEETLHMIFREAHSLKGAARVLGAEDIETVAHIMEEKLGMAHRREIFLTRKDYDIFYSALDAMKDLVLEELQLKERKVNVVDLAHQLQNAGSSLENPKSQNRHSDENEPFSKAKNQPSIRLEAQITDTNSIQKDLVINIIEDNDPLIKAKVFDPSSDTENGTDNSSLSKKENHTPDLKAWQKPGGIDSARSKDSNSELSTVSSSSPFSVTDASQAKTQFEPKKFTSSIRVPSEKMDLLMNQAGELTIAKIRLFHRVLDLDLLLDSCELTSRDMVINKDLPGKLLSAPSSEQVAKAGKLLNQFFAQIETITENLQKIKHAMQSDNARLEQISQDIESNVRKLRLLTFSSLFSQFHRLVRDLAKEQGKEIRLVLEGENTNADKMIIEQMKDPMVHLVRNAIDHGIESTQERRRLGKSEQGTVKFRAYQTANEVVLEITDDGGGLDAARIKKKALEKNLVSKDRLDQMNEQEIFDLIFEPNFSTKAVATKVSGRGVGMNVVKTNITKLKGRIVIHSILHQGTTFKIFFPVSVATNRVFIIQTNGNFFAIPVEYVRTNMWIRKKDVIYLSSRPVIKIDDSPISIVTLAKLLRLQTETDENGNLKKEKKKRVPCIVLSSGTRELALVVDKLIDETDIIIKPNKGILRRVKNVAGSAILESGDICTVLNMDDIFDTFINQTGRAKTQINENQKKQSGIPATKHILLVEDSTITRLHEKRLLESVGYDVIDAKDGMEGWEKLHMHTVEAVISDVEMPRMNGFELTQKIRSEPKWKDLPIILVTTLNTQEHRARGLDAGADAYITKDRFDYQVLYDTLQRLL